MLLDVYAYNHVFKIAKQIPDFSSESLYLIELLKERRELNLNFLYEHAKENQVIEEKWGIDLLLNTEIEDEQIANYILDLEVKVKNGDIIDFVRSVSPILYRLFLRLARKEIAQFDLYIIDSKSDQYDTWNFKAMQEAHNPIFEKYLSQKQSRNITSKSLADILQFSQLPQEIKETVKELRKFEKSVRNPLAHLIKAFDEEELYRTTRFSSQTFLDKIIALASFSGVNYQRQPFYFDQINRIIEGQVIKK
ncbi:LytR family transcriptional regulator [Streptococcus didelphis]|uniref:LytR family transcriptional regulator n=1 Tax=Streptococcus didelphis TaxID=102886 RepID=A0ABY9LJ28_9STRE|nr:LytR family transcriptional regulator [Streptococcus didelphis]WMB28849.1 LytR family transcriptional regulator [Streptococcus didelphis]